ncbi:MAG: hypothetical protein RLN69_01735 [Woeseiaceae bacterium]
MTFISTLAPEDAVGDVQEMYRRQQAAWGYVPNYAMAFSHRPEVLARWGRLLAEIRRPMSDRRFELVTFAAALELRNSACSLAHGKQLAAFFSYEEIAAMAAGEYGPSLTDAEREIVKFARICARDATAVTSRDVERLREHGITDAEVFDIVATAAGRAFFTKLLDGLGVELDATFSSLNPALRESVATATRSTAGVHAPTD